MLRQETFQLGIEQRIAIARIAVDCKDMTDDEIRDALIQTIAQIMVADNQIKALVRGATW